MKRLGLSVALLLCLPSLASAQLLDGQREQHRQEPAYNGSTANAPIPANLHVRNEGGSDGAGLCVIASLRINGRYQGVPGVEQIWAKAKTRPGGYSPGKLQGLLDETVPAEKWASYVGTNTGVLDQLSKAGYPIGATMNTGELYNYAPIHHMVSLVHYDQAKDLACVVDNNRPGVFSWMTAREFSRRWIDGGTGWAFVWTRKAAMAVAGGGGIVLLVAAAVAALVIAIKGRADDAFGVIE